MNAKDYLLQIKKLEHQIERMKVRSKEYEHLADGASSPSYGKEIVDGTKCDKAPFVRWLNKKDELDHEIRVLEETLENLKVEVILKIERIDSENHKIILIKRYFEGKSWEDIRNALFTSKATIYRWHDEALAKLDGVLKDETP